MEINPVKGTHDVIEDEAVGYQEIEMLLRGVAELRGYCEYRTPVLEHTELFTRSVGDSSDIVRKEMYQFLDKGGRSLTLRPEFTASIVRSVVNAKLYATHDLPIKAYYVGPAFRYERPQAGRYRQFNQFGVECLGIRSPFVDSEVISLGYNALKMMGFENVTLKINTLGDDASKENYKKAIKEYFAPYIENMCYDCKERYELNPLRILDCKDPEDQKIIANAPKMSDYLNEESKAYYKQVLDTLNELQIPFAEDDTLVRGLDYYSDVVFEYHYYNAEGKSIGALGAGGHYDKLINELGGGKLDGVGLAFGVERLYSVLKDLNLLEEMHNTIDLYIMPISANEIQSALLLAEDLRHYGFKTEVNYDPKSMKSQFKRAERKYAKYALILGETELNNQEVVLKDMAKQEQQTVKFVDLIETLDGLFSEQAHRCNCGCEDDGCCCCDDEDHECCCGEHEENGEEHHCCCHHHDK